MMKGEKQAHLAKVVKDDMGVPKKQNLSTTLNVAEQKRVADLKKLHKEIGSALAKTQKAIDDEAAAFAKKQRAKAKAEEKRKREEVRRRIEEEEAERKAEEKRVRAEIKLQLEEELARKEALEKKKKELASMERKKLLEAKQRDEHHTKKALSDWKKTKKLNFEKDLAQRLREAAQEEALTKKKLRESQKEWQAQEAVRLAAEAALAKRKQEETAKFHSTLRQKYVEEEIVRYEHKLDAEKREAEKAMKAAAYAAEAAEREAAIAREKAERFNNVQSDAASAQFSFKIW